MPNNTRGVSRLKYDYQEVTHFNSSIEYLKRMERRWEDADQSKIAGDTMTYFRVLETIYRNAHPFFSEEEQKTCEEIVKKIESLLETNYQQKDLRAAGIFIGENQCDKFRMILVKLLFKYKITYAKKEKIDLEDEVEDDY